MSFTITDGDLSYTATWVGAGFDVQADQTEGRRFLRGVTAGVELAYMAELAQATYMPTSEMIEFCTARRLGIELDPPEMGGEPGVIY